RRSPGGRANVFVVRALATQRLLHTCCPQRTAAHTGQADRYVGDIVAADGDLGRDRDDRPVLRPPAELEVGPCAAGRWCGDADLANDLIRLQRRGKRIDEEVSCRNVPFALGAHDLEDGVDSRSFINGIRLCPPARTFASCPRLTSSATASGRVRGTT